MVVVGPRQCGKTTLLQSLTLPWRIIDLEKGADSEAVAADPELFLSLHPDQVTIDGAQIHPALFPALRLAIDSDRGKTGRYVITGSRSPELAKTVTESLAGRAATIEMGPLSWSEIHPSGEPCLLDLLLDPKSRQTVNQAEVARALGVSPPTIRDYFEIATGSFLWRSLPAYTRNVTKRVIKHAKGHVRDSGLEHHALRIPDVAALLAHPQAGNSWEGMVVEEVCRQLEQRGVSYDAYHYRAGGGAEVDLVLDGGFGLIAIVISNEERPRLIADDVVGIAARYL